MSKKGIILAGGLGTRLHPMTSVVSKQLMPVYDKPMIYYPLSVLMLAGITEILVITAPQDQPAFTKLLGDGGQWGLTVAYRVQPKPEGIAQALIIGHDYVEGGGCALILGDNIFFGHGLVDQLSAAVARERGATVFGYLVRDPQRYGVVELDEDDRPVALEEKPADPRSPWAITGLYFYDSRASEIAAGLRPSARGELEITDVNRAYLELGELHVERLGRGYAWLDTGTPESLLQAAQFVQTIEERQSVKIACPEEIAFRKGFIDRDQLRKLAHALGAGPYGRYLEAIAEEGSVRKGTRP